MVPSDKDIDIQLFQVTVIAMSVLYLEPKRTQMETVSIRTTNRKAALHFDSFIVC